MDEKLMMIMKNYQDELKKIDAKYSRNISYDITNQNNGQKIKVEKSMKELEKDIQERENYINSIKENMQTASNTELAYYKKLLKEREEELNGIINAKNKEELEVSKLKRSTVTLESGRETTMAEKDKLDKASLRNNAIKQLTQENKEISGKISEARVRFNSKLIEMNNFKYEYETLEDGTRIAKNGADFAKINEEIENIKKEIGSLEKAQEKCENYIKMLKGSREDKNKENSDNGNNGRNDNNENNNRKDNRNNNRNDNNESNNIEDNNDNNRNDNNSITPKDDRIEYIGELLHDNKLVIQRKKDEVIINGKSYKTRELEEIKKDLKESEEIDKKESEVYKNIKFLISGKGDMDILAAMALDMDEQLAKYKNTDEYDKASKEIAKKFAENIKDYAELIKNPDSKERSNVKITYNTKRKIRDMFKDRQGFKEFKEKAFDSRKYANIESGLITKLQFKVKEIRENREQAKLNSGEVKTLNSGEDKKKSFRERLEVGTKKEKDMKKQSLLSRAKTLGRNAKYTVQDGLENISTKFRQKATKFLYYPEGANKTSEQNNDDRDDER